MGQQTKLSEADLIQMLRVHFHLVAETMAEIASIRGDRFTVKLTTQIDGHDVGAALFAVKRADTEE